MAAQNQVRGGGRRGGGRRGRDAPEVPWYLRGEGPLNSDLAADKTPQEIENENNEKIFKRLEDSGRVSQEELHRFDIVPEDLLDQHSSLLHDVHNQRASLSHLATTRRESLNFALDGLSHSSKAQLAGKAATRLKEHVDLLEDKIKRAGGRSFAIPKAFEMDPVLKPKEKKGKGGKHK